MKKKLGNRARENKLKKHFNSNYGKFENEIEFYCNPNDFTWRFKVPSLNRTVLLTVDDYGVVEEF